MKQAPIAIERILCPVDFSEFSVLAFAYASSLAQHFRAKLFTQYVIEMGQYPSADFSPNADAYDEFCATLLCQGEARLRAFIQEHRQYDADPQCICSKGMAADTILCFAKQKGIDLIVMGTHGHRGFERLMLGSATEKVLRMAQCPVLAVPEPDRESDVSKDVVDLHRIIACTDFSEYSERALHHAIFVAEEYKADLTLVHVLENVSTPGCVADTTTAYKRLDELISSQGKLEITITTAVRIGRSYREICRLAKDDRAELVIMAVHGGNSSDRAIFGSTTYRVIQSGTCPVLTIPA
jgi:nucleotide-binding universal stress UspA family protein